MQDAVKYKISSRREVLFLASVLFVTQVCILLIIAYSVLRVNDEARQTGKDFFESVIADKEKQLALLSKDYGYWDGTIDNAYLSQDLTWIEENIGGYLAETFDITDLRIIGSDDKDVLLLRDGAPVQGDSGRGEWGDIAALIERARVSTGIPEPVSGLTTINGIPAFVAAAILASQNDTRLPLPRPVLILAKRMEPGLLESLSKQYNMQGLQLCSQCLGDRDKATVELLDVNGQAIGGLSWVYMKPGSMVVGKVTAPLIILLMVTAVVVYFLLKYGFVSERKEILRALKLSEEKYQLAMEATNDGLWDWDVATGSVSYSSGWARILEEVEIGGEYEVWERRIHPDDKEQTITTLCQHLEGKTQRWYQEHRLLTHSGDWKWVLGRGRVVERGADGTPVRMIGTMTDIAERKRSELEKEQLRLQLTQAQKMETIGQLTGGIAHDFNNLLGIINGYTDLAINQIKANSYERLSDYLGKISETGDRAATLVRQMLIFSRREKVEHVSVDISELLGKTLTLIRSTIPTTIDVVTKIDPNLPKVLLNAAQFEQILMNLAINSRDAMSGVGTLTITLRLVYDLNTYSTISHLPIKGDWIELSVRDTGTGIEEELINKIFDPFFTTKEVGKGTGMGLSVVMRIIEEVGGHIIIDSKRNSGTKICLLFPPLQ